jgi:hypothetical protein
MPEIARAVQSSAADSARRKNHDRLSLRRASHLLLLALVALALAACGGVEVEEVGVRLVVDRDHRCEGEGLGGVEAVYVALARRGSTQTFKPCVDTFKVYNQLSQLQGRLRSQVSFEHLQGGTWDIWVMGASTPCWQPASQFRLCGTATLAVPGTTEVGIPIDCEDPLSDSATLEKAKASIKACRATMPPWVYFGGEAP